MEENEHSDVDNVQENESYGWFVLRPRYLQPCNKVQWNVFWQSVFSFFEGFIVNGVINIIIPALEKRYKLSSKKSSFIASANDIGGILIFLLIGYFGEHAHKPRLMAAGVIVMSLGSLIFALPHFVGDPYQYEVSDVSTNQAVNLCSNTSCGGTASDELSYNAYYVMFILGQMLLGIGAVPMFTVGLTYIDDNCKQKMTSFYISLTFCTAAIGVAVGYIVGGQTLSLFVDIDKVDQSSILLTPADPQWAGAWWIGIIVTCTAFILISIPLLGFPKRLPDYHELKRQKKSEVHSGASDDLPRHSSFGKNLKDFPRALFLLIKNPAYSFLVLGATIELLLIGGLSAFGAKIITVLFNVDLTEAGNAMGIVTIIGSGGGMLFGGYIVKKLKLQFRRIVLLCIICTSTCLLLAPSFLARCPTQQIAGVFTPYTDDQSINLISTCNSNCHCTTSGFEPICDNSKMVYFTPCHAGCTGVTKFDGQKMYNGCQCLNRTTLVTTPSDPEVVAGTCSGKCSFFYIFCVMLFFIMFLTFMTMSPIVTAMFRCVPNDQRSLAISSQLLIGKLLGTIPGPVLLGTIIDSTCEVWQDTCGVAGSCWIYRKDDLGMLVMVWWLALNICGSIFFVLAFKLYRAPEDVCETHVTGDADVTGVTEEEENLTENDVESDQ